MPTGKKLGNQIRTLRDARGYNQEALGALCNVGRAQISKVEADAAGASVKLLLQIGEALGKELSFIDPEDSYLFAANPRGITLSQALRDIGLVDMENRDDRQHLLPPEEFFAAATREIAITGISAYRTFDQDLDIIHEVLKKDRKIFVLILRPKCADVERFSRRERRDISSDIQGVISVIKREGLHKHPRFRIKFLESLPSFTAVMIDGDIDTPTGELPSNDEGQIRVQPVLVHHTQHSGLVIQLKKKTRGTLGVFEYFAEDLRKQWRDGKEDP